MELTSEFKNNLLDLRRQIDEYLLKSAGASYPASLYQPINYFLEFGGKRLRPLLTLLACKAVGSDYRQALPAACAIELLHNFTLVHDDIMDQDTLRRGHPTVHTKWSESVAILTGDGLIGLAYRALMNTPPETLQQVTKIFTEGVIRVCEGQAIDKDFEERQQVGVEEYFDMIQKKTGELIAVSTEIGGIVGHGASPQIKALREFGEAIGRAFQIQDDMLDIVSSEDVLGKDLGSDLAQGKKTFIIIKLKELSSPEEWEYIQNILRRRRIDHSTLEKIKTIMNNNKVIDAAVEQIHSDIHRAQNSLSSAFSPAGAEELTQFSLMILHRKY